MNDVMQAMNKAAGLEPDFGDNDEPGALSATTDANSDDERLQAAMNRGAGLPADFRAPKPSGTRSTRTVAFDVFETPRSERQPGERDWIFTLEPGAGQRLKKPTPYTDVFELREE